VNLLGDIIDTMKKNTETLIDANKVAALEANTQKRRYILLFGRQNAGEYHDIKICGRVKIFWEQQQN
jgi:hypothetical protein